MSSARKFWSYNCEWDGCGKSFKSISTFEAHYRRHTDHRPYACDYGSCDQSFHDRGALNRHLRTHANERTLACKYVSCGQVFHDSKALDQHHLTHADQRPFTCKYDSCGQAFHDREQLSEHHRAHKQRPLACEYDSCSRTFARGESLEAHMHMHTENRPFTCSYEACSKAFCDRESLTQHENSHTKINTRPSDNKPRNETFTKPSQLPRHHREGDETNTTSVEDVRPVRLRLSQPKRQNPESLDDSPRKRVLIRIPMRKIVGVSSTSDPTTAQQNSSESKNSAKRSTNYIEERNADQHARPSNSSIGTIPTSETSGKHRSSSRGLKISAPAMQRVATPNVRSQAPVLEPAIKSRPAESKSAISFTDGESIGHDSSVYTSVCGVYSIEKASPSKVKAKGGHYHCPRCDTQFTRSSGVRTHFVGCVTRYGNPDSLKWTDHQSLQNTARFYARNGHQGQQPEKQSEMLSHTQDVRITSRELTKHALLHSRAPKPLPSVVRESTRSVEPVGTADRSDALLRKDIVRPIDKRQDALRRSTYNPETIARDVLVATGSHPSMDPLNSHLDMLRTRFRDVNLESNMSTFRWDLVDAEPEQELKRLSEREPVRQVGQDAKPEQSAPSASISKTDKIKSESNDVHWNYGTPFSLPSRYSTKPNVSYNETPFSVTLPEEKHFGPMSTIFCSVFDRDPSAKLMSVGAELWAAIFTMLERCYDGQNFMIRAAFSKDSDDIIGWVACHEVETPQAMPVEPLAYLDWTTAAHLLPSQVSRFTSAEKSAKGRAEVSNQRNIDQSLASTIQARATEAQTYLVPIRRLVINALVVHPSHQGLGVASALLKSITKVTDIKKEPIWIQAPEDPAVTRGVRKAGLFRRAGFTCAGELNLDLDSYVSEPRMRRKGKGVSFGTYKWNYMLRWPQQIG